MSILDNIKSELNKKGKTQTDLTDYLKIRQSVFSNWNSGISKSYMKYLPKIAQFLNVSVDRLLSSNKNGINIDDNFISFPVIGEVAAGFDHIAAEDWSGDTVNIPESYLKGRSKEDFFVLRVSGDSMFPTYQDGDKVLVLKQNTLNHSGQVGVVLYGGENGTLKKVEYAYGENWIKLVPINPNYMPIKIQNADLEQCRILGIPKLLIREIRN